MLGAVIPMARQVNVHEAKTQFSRLLTRVQEGEEIVILKAGRSIARLVPLSPRVPKRRPGSARGRVRIDPGFDEPLPEDLLQAFEQ